MSYCTASRRNGEPCRAQALPERLLCWAHDPQMREKADEARRKGGLHKSSTVRAAKHVPPDMKALARQLMESIDEVHRGELMPDQARAMASLAGAVVRVYEVGELRLEVQELRERLEGSA